MTISKEQALSALIWLRQHIDVPHSKNDAANTLRDYINQQAEAMDRLADSRDIIAQSVAGALERAGVTECDDPGESIDVIVEDFKARIAELEQQRDREVLELIDDRDAKEAMADKLASAIAERFGVDIGEHSSGNCPWQNALETVQSSGAQGEPPYDRPSPVAAQAQPIHPAIREGVEAAFEQREGWMTKIAAAVRHIPVVNQSLTTEQPERGADETPFSQQPAVPEGWRHTLEEALAMMTSQPMSLERQTDAVTRVRALLSAQQPVHPLDWPTDEMVVRGAEALHDGLREAGCQCDFDHDMRGTERQQFIAEQVFTVMLDRAQSADGEGQ